MKQVQKRYIYSGVTSALFFIVIYGIMDFNIFLSVILTACIYLGGIFLFKEKDIRTLDSESINNYYFWASRVANRAELTKDERIIALAESITSTTDAIIVSLSQRPKKVEQVFSFFDYYLDIAYKMLYRYNILKDKENVSQKDQAFLESVPTYLEKIAGEFTRQLSNMQESKMLDIENEIKIFESSLGIKKTDIEVGDINEK